MKIVRIVSKTLVWLLVIGAVVFIGQKLYAMIQREYLLPLKYERLVEEYAAEYDLEEPLVYAVMKNESNFDPKAVSRAGAVGLMQIMPSTYEYLVTLTGEEYDPSQLKNPETSIRYGCLQLSRMKNRFGDGPEMLAAYNAGEGKVAGWLQDASLSENGRLTEIPIEETREYVERVQNTKEQYISLYGEEKEWKQ